MLTFRRLVAVVLVAIAGAVVYTGWLGWQVSRDLSRAQQATVELRTALQDRDAGARESATDDLSVSASRAAERTGGRWWRSLGWLPILGDDVDGVRVLSSTLADLADVAPSLGRSLDLLDRVSVPGRIDLEVLRELRAPVLDAERAFAAADAELSSQDSSGYAAALQEPYDELAEAVADGSRRLAPAATAVRVLPTMLGADGPRDHLLMFQSNAEIRATGGLPGVYMLIHAEDGRLEIVREARAADFGELASPVLPLSRTELALYGPQLGTYIQDAGFTPDFPRSAQLTAARWERQFPSDALDGVIAIDPVSLSYLLAGTGPVQVPGGPLLTADNAIEELLHRPYVDLSPVEQDLRFAAAARALFTAVTGSLTSPVDFVSGAARAAREGRLLLSSFDPEVRTLLEGSEVEGAVPADDEDAPHVEIGVNDTTASKMSYFLRYDAELTATACEDGVQSLSGAMELSQTISRAEAVQLPVSVTGDGRYGIAPGTQLVSVRLYGPTGGSIDRVELAGRSLTRELTVHRLDGRPVVLVPVFLTDSEPVPLTWEMTTGPGQRGDATLGLTPSVVPGSVPDVFPSAC